MEERPTPRRWLVAAPLSLAALVLLLALPDLARPVHNTIEAIRIACAQSMVEGGHWLIPETWGRPYIFKPPLSPWIIAAGGLVAGRVDETIARLATAVASVVLLLTLWGVSRRPLGSGRAWLAALILISTYDFAHRAAYALIDLPLMLALGAAVWAFFRGLEAEEGREGRAFGAVHLLGAVAALLKGPLALAVLGAVAVPTAMALGRPRALLNLVRRRTTLLWLLPAAWYGAVALSGGEAARSLLSTELTQQVTGLNEHEPPLWYLNTLATHFFPWGLLLPLTVVPAWRRHRRLATFVVVWAVATFLLFSLSAEKTHRYLMPIYPAVAAWIALGIDSKWAARGLSVASVITAVVAAAGAIGAAFAPLWVEPGHNYLHTVVAAHAPFIAAAFAAMAVAAAGAGHLAWHGRPLRGTALLAVALAALQGPGYWHLQSLPSHDPRVPLARVRTLVGDAPFAVYAWTARDQGSLPYYLGRKPTELATADAAIAHLAPGATYLLLPEARWAEIAAQTDRLREVYRFPFQPNKGRVETLLLATRDPAAPSPPPEAAPPTTGPVPPEPSDWPTPSEKPLDSPPPPEPQEAAPCPGPGDPLPPLPPPTP